MGPFLTIISVAVGDLYWKCSALNQCWVHCCLGMRSLLSPGWLVFHKVDVPSSFRTRWHGLYWSVLENQKIGLMSLLLVWIFLTLVPYQGPGAHMIFQVTIIDEKMPLQSYFYLPTPGEDVSAQPSSDFTESTKRLFLRPIMCGKWWVIPTAGSKPCLSKGQFQGWKLQNSLFELSDLIFVCICLQTAVGR